MGILGTKESYGEIPDVDISEDEAKKPIQRAKSGKDAEADRIITELLKSAEQEITPVQARYYNVLLSSSQFPLKWTKAIIVSLRKKLT